MRLLSQRRHSSASLQGAGIIGLGIILATLLIGWWQASEWYEEFLTKEKRADIQSNLIPYGKALATELNLHFAQLEGLAAFVQINPTRRDLDLHFADYANGLYTGKAVIRAIQIFPRDGPIYVYPISSNEPVLERTLEDLINDERPEVQADVHRTIETRQVATSGPLELRQGGSGFLARLAVYQDDELSSIAVIVLDMPALLSQTGLNPLPDGLEVALGNADGELIIGNSAVFSAEPETYPVNLPDSTWTLAMIPAGGWQDAIHDSLVGFRVIGMIIIGLVFGTAYLIMARQTQLARAVHERTAELTETHERYRTLVEQSPYAIAVHQDDTLVFVNPATVRLMGATHADELIGKSINDFIPPDAREAAYARKQRLIQGDTSMYPLENRYVRLDGAEVPVEITVTPFTHHGQPAAQVIALDITERKRAEEALRAREERFRLAMENIPDVVVIYDRDLRIQFINSATTALTGRSREDFLGKRDEDVLPPEIYGCYLPTLKEALATKETRKVECTLALQDDILPLSLIITCVPVLDEQGNVREVLGFTHDDTERKQFEQSLQASEERLRLFIEHAPASLAMFDREMRYIAVSNRWKTDYQLGDQDIIGRSHYDIFPDIPDRWKPLHQRGLAGEVVKNDDDIFTRGDGTIQRERWELHPWYTAENDIGGIVIFVEDITIRKQAEEKLRRYSEHLALLHEIDRGIIAAQTPEDILQAIMPHLSHVFAFKRTSLALFNENLTQVTFAGEIDQVSALPVRSTHDTVPGANLKQLKAGEILSIPDYDQIENRSHILQALYDEGIRSSLSVPLIIEDRLFGVFSVYSRHPHHFDDDHAEIATDIGAQLAIALRQTQMIAKIEAYTEELEQRVIERTAQLEAKTQELETFNYTVSHDLKAPLRGIDGYSRLLLEDYKDHLDKEGQTFLENIRLATDQMNTLINDLLVYSRLERRNLSPMEIQVEEFTQSVVAEFSNEIGERNAIVTIDVPCDSLLTDPNSLAMALRNLIDNALKFTRNTHTPAIEVGGRDTDASCILWVKDNGIGFDTQYHDRIFEIFQRLHRVEDYAGTGIGLAIVRKAIERAGGRVWATSKPGHGATFYLEIPR